MANANESGSGGGIKGSSIKNATKASQRWAARNKAAAAANAPF